MEVSEPVLLILLSLAEQPRHGYAILQDTERMSEGRVRLSTGTLYGALRRLLEDKWIERFKEHDSSRGRQAYRLTAAGRRNLQMEVTRLKHLTRVAALVQIPVLLAAVFYIYLPKMMFLEPRQSLEFSSLVLFLLLLFAAFGAGRWSLDHYLSRKIAPDAYKDANEVPSHAQ